jgi:hypothetical protein
MNIMNVVALSVAERAVWLWCDEILAPGEKIMIDSDVAPVPKSKPKSQHMPITGMA